MISKKFLICTILLIIFSLNIVCAEDNTTLSDSLSEEIEEESQIENVEIIEENDDKLSENNNYTPSSEDTANDSAENNSTVKKDLDIRIISDYYHMYPWTGADDDGDSSRGIYIIVYNPHTEYKPSENFTIYFNEEIGVSSSNPNYLDPYELESKLWEKYTANGYYNVSVVYPGDEHFNPINETESFYLGKYMCGISETSIVYLTLESCVSGNLTVEVNGKTYSKRINGSYHWYNSGYSDETHDLN